MSQDEQDIVNELEEQYGAGFGDVGAREGREQFPKGNYAFSCTNAYINRSAGSGRKQLTAVLVVKETNAGDELVGKDYYKIWGLETEENLKWLNGDLLNLDIPVPSKPAALLNVVKQLIGIGLQGSMVPNTDEAFPSNLYLNRGARRMDLESGEKAKTDNF